MLTRSEGNIDYNWGYGSPARNIQSDYFAARWTQTVNLQPVRYRFIATTDDGVQVWVNNVLVVNGWYEHAAATFTGEIDIPSGQTWIIVYYFEQAGVAEAHLRWERVDGTPPGGNYTAWVLSHYLNVRSGPGAGYAIRATIPNGTVVTLTHRNYNASWVRIQLANGVIGWVLLSWQQSQAIHLPAIVGRTRSATSDYQNGLGVLSQRAQRTECLLPRIDLFAPQSDRGDFALWQWWLGGSANTWRRGRLGQFVLFALRV